MSAQVTTESLLAAINQAVLAVEQAQETLIAQLGNYNAHLEADATAAAKGHVLLKDAMGDEAAANGATALTPKALKDFDTANTNVIINVRDMLRLEVEAVSGGRNTIIRDTHGTPHVMVVIPKFYLQDIDPGLGTGIHPAFIVNGVEKPEIFIGKYQASKGAGNAPETLPRKVPYSGARALTAVDRCRALGTGFCCVTNAMWSARALWLWKHFGGAEGDHLYRGNNQNGVSAGARYLSGTLASDAAVLGANSSSSDGRTLTGSGPVEWNDDGTPTGICDFVGNTMEYVAGLRAVAGELQVVENNNAALASCDLGEESSAWKAILQNGNLVAPGTSGTLKYTSPGAEQIVLTDGESDYSANVGCEVKDISADDITVPGIVKALGLYPVANNVQGKIFYGGTGFEAPTYPARGGFYYVSDTGIGPFMVGFYGNRSNTTVSFRVGYVA